MHKNSHKGIAGNRCVVVFQLLGVDGSALREALTHKKLTAKGEEVTFSFCPCSSCYQLFRVYCINLWLYLLLCVTDDKPFKFWAGSGCPWCLSQGRVWSDLHLVGGEDQPVAGCEGTVRVPITTQRQQWSCCCVLPLIACCDMFCRMKSTTAVRPPQL